jgi:hypothetical protein
LHELVLEDLPLLQHHILLHYEFLHPSPALLLEAVGSVLGWGSIAVGGEGEEGYTYSHANTQSKIHTRLLLLLVLYY